MQHHPLQTKNRYNSQSILPLAAWEPMAPVTGGADQPLFHAYILAPGFSTAFHAATLGRSAATICRYRRIANAAVRSDPSVRDLITEFVCSITPEIALAMARARGRTQMPYWSRLAVGEFLKRGMSRKEVARLFKCSVRTVANIVNGKGKSFVALSGSRHLSESQVRPPALTRKNSSDRQSACLRQAKAG